MSQHLEQHPKGAKTMGELPGALLEWEKNLRRCSQEGRKPPDDDWKRLTLLKMLPKAQRVALWDTADKLYPTFGELLTKIQAMIQDEADGRLGFGPMDVDHIDDDEEGTWTSTGQAFSGKGANGEETLFLLQKRGNLTTS